MEGAFYDLKFIFINAKQKKKEINIRQNMQYNKQYEKNYKKNQFVI